MHGNMYAERRALKPAQKGAPAKARARFSLSTLSHTDFICRAENYPINPFSFYSSTGEPGLTDRLTGESGRPGSFQDPVDTR